MKNQFQNSKNPKILTIINSKLKKLTIPKSEKPKTYKLKNFNIGNAKLKS